VKARQNQFAGGVLGISALTSRFRVLETRRNTTVQLASNTSNLTLYESSKCKNPRAEAKKFTSLEACKSKEREKGEARWFSTSTKAFCKL